MYSSHSSVSEPYLSFVVAARNDNYGGNFLHRFQNCVNSLSALCEEHNLDAELVIVEWNPPEKQSRLRDALTWSECLKSIAVRVIEVSGEMHHRFPSADRMPMFEYIAKNVGIRRATGQYVVATNPDIIFSYELVKSFASRTFSADCFYRVDRYDVEKLIPLNLRVNQQLEFCRRNAFRVHRQSGSQPTARLVRLRLQIIRNLSRLSPRRIIRSSLRRTRKVITQSQPVTKTSLLPPVHTNASGDFLLMSRERWHALRGFPELKTHSHIDSYMCYLASFAGLQQVVLPSPIYHQEHDRSESADRPLTNLGALEAMIAQTGKLETVNDETWGLGTAVLPITVIGG